MDRVSFSNELTTLLAPFLASQRRYEAIPDPRLEIRRVDTIRFEFFLTYESCNSNGVCAAGSRDMNGHLPQVPHVMTWHRLVARHPAMVRQDATSYH